MGLNLSGSIDRARHPESYPDRSKGPTFDPMYGFPDGRKPKGKTEDSCIYIANIDYGTILLMTTKGTVPPYTEEEMQILNIPLDKRDYCAHYFRAIMICTQQYWPSQYAYCAPELHAWEECQIKNKIDAAKEYERELRLRRRRLRKEEQANRHSEHISTNEE